MARFRTGQPITTAEPVIVVDAGLKPGRHRFELVVTAADGRESEPDQAIVVVIDPTIVGPPVNGT